MHTKILSGLLIVVNAVLIVSCASGPSNSTPAAHNSLATQPTAAIGYSPANVLIYNENNTQLQSADNITMIQVDVYNEYGIRRQQAQVNEILKQQACSVGGNAVVILDNPDKKHCYAKVVNTAVPSTLTSATPPVSVMK